MPEFEEKKQNVNSEADQYLNAKKNTDMASSTKSNISKSSTRNVDRKSSIDNDHTSNLRSRWKKKSYARDGVKTASIGEVTHEYAQKELLKTTDSDDMTQSHRRPNPNGEYKPRGYAFQNKGRSKSESHFRKGVSSKLDTESKNRRGERVSSYSPQAETSTKKTGIFKRIIFKIFRKKNLSSKAGDPVREGSRGKFQDSFDRQSNKDGHSKYRNNRKRSSSGKREDRTRDPQDVRSRSKESHSFDSRRHKRPLSGDKRKH